MSGRRTSKADTARQAIDYLLKHDFKLHWDFDPADPPPEEVRQLLKPYFDDGEIEGTTAMHLCDYLVGELRWSYLPKAEWSRCTREHSPCSRPANCRVVRGDE